MSTPTADYGVSGILRLTLLTHGMTNAMSADGLSPTDEPPNALGIRQVARLERDLGSTDRVVAGPETRTRQTAELRGWQPTFDPALADRTAAPGTAAPSPTLIQSLCISGWPTLPAHPRRGIHHRTDRPHRRLASRR